ncbi:MAG: (E)-4-hydroxy-3-methylbut-2-enyl-diphosphate synthase [Bacteroidales bacterium]|nr:(E)-4-hydroxy-3-methylbut-2-enyl-diphosphate synthase [Bacteroidales bacterium]MDD4499144.1 (E)-4-hydroxy-3-methylbut-2-enyl-diphosphate synthase [Bacteroidales bacterium]MDY0239729.1 (E)-4-hydroxy-3-methylbut-2-enyl-diphosphate synthase [Bacteroidales bacterium]
MKTHTVFAGNLAIGGGNPVSVQTMCNTDTLDIEASVAQCERVAREGAQLIRLTTQGPAQVKALAVIKERLRAQGIDVPLAADVHFSASTAMEAARVAEKVRINPGNFSRDLSRVKELLSQFFDICREHKTCVRIGVNHGSLPPHILETYGNSPEGMCRAAMEYLSLCRELDFDNVIVSLKSSNTRIMVQANRMLVARMEEAGMSYPVHLGVTESGSGRQGRLKSAAGIITLLKEGIGDTFRVSLTEAPEEEIRFGKLFLSVKEEVRVSSWDELIVSACYKWAPGLLDGTTDWKALPMPFVQASFANEEALKDFCMDLLQATRCVFTKPEYISCPGCGRTKFNLEETVRDVKEATAHLKGCTIAIMGCIVNGPGEMADAQYGYVGEGNGKITLYKGKTPVMRGIPQEEAVQRLLELIESQQK